MIVLFKKNLNLFVKVRMDFRIPIKYQNKVFSKGIKEELLLPEEVEFILTRNGNLRIWDGGKYVKLNLGQFFEIMKNKKYRVEEIKEPKKEVKVEQPKAVPVEVKEEPKQVEVKKEEIKEQPVENKKQRHNKQQGGDK